MHYCYEAVFSQSVGLLESRDADSPNVREITGEVWARGSDDTRIRVGALQAIQMDLWYGSALLEADAHSQDLAEVVSAFWNPAKLRFVPAIENLFPDQSALLYLQLLQIEDAHRGRDLGLATIAACLERFGNSNAGTLAILKPCPLQFAEGPLDEALVAKYAARGFTTESKRAFASLTKHWARLGFRRIAKTDFWAWSCDQATPDWSRKPCGKRA